MYKIKVAVYFQKKLVRAWENDRVINVMIRKSTLFRLSCDYLLIESMMRLSPRQRNLRLVFQVI